MIDHLIQFDLNSFLGVYYNLRYEKIFPSSHFRIQCAFYGKVGTTEVITIRSILLIIRIFIISSQDSVFDIYVHTHRDTIIRC